MDNFKGWLLRKAYYTEVQLATTGLVAIKYVPPEGGYKTKVSNAQMDANFHLFFEWIVYKGLSVTQNLMLLLEYYQEQPYESSRDGERIV